MSFPTEPVPQAIPKTRRRPQVTPVVLSLTTGNPAHVVGQDEARKLAVQLYPRLAARQQLLDVFENARIDTRHVTMPPEWYSTPHSWAEKNAIACQEELRLSVEVAARAIAEAGLTPEDVQAVVFVSSSAVSAPNLDSHLVEALGMSPHAARVPMFGLGCAGGVSGIARAADLVRAGYEHVLLVAVELCSLTFVAQDASSSNFVATALFGDGAAAVVLGGEWPGEEARPSLLRLYGAYSTLIRDSADVMGWDVLNEGLKVRFAKSIPDLVRRTMRANVTEAVEREGWTVDELTRFVVHPGGARVLKAYGETLELPEDTLALSYEVLRRYGNMSSPTVLFVLAEHLKESTPGRAIMSAMGPGFCVEHILLEFPKGRSTV